MLPGRLPATWPPGGTRDAKYKDHAMRGRKPKPTALKLLDGTRADRINHDEPATPPASIEPPDWLDETARAHWGDLAPCSPIVRVADGRVGLAIANGQKQTASGDRQFSGAPSAQSHALCREDVWDILSYIVRDQAKSALHT